MPRPARPGGGPAVCTLVLLRHAKADRPAGLADHERPLTARGRRDASAAGQWLADQGLVPDLVLCSDALRGRQTWESAAAALGGRGDRVPVRYEPGLYDTDVPAVVHLVAGTGQDVATLLVVGHEPTMSAVAQELAGPRSDQGLLAEVADHLPTSGVAVLEQEGSWRDVEAGSAALVRLAAPRG